MNPGKKAVNIGVIILLLGVCVLFVPTIGAMLGTMLVVGGFFAIVVGRMVEP